MAAHGVLVIRVTAIDKYVARLQKRDQLRNGVVNRLALRNHNPDSSPAIQLLNQILKSRCAHVASSAKAGNSLRAEVEADNPMAPHPQPFRHVPAHFSKADQSE